MYKTIFENRSKVLSKTKNPTIMEVFGPEETAMRAKRRESFIWAVPLDVLNGDREIVLGPSQVYEHPSPDEFAPYARYEKICLDVGRDENGDTVPKLTCHLRKGFEEPEWPDLSIVLINDDPSTLNSPPTYWTETFKVTVPFGIETIVPCSYISAVAKYSGLIYQPVVIKKVFDPRVESGYRISYEGGAFVGTMRTKEELKQIQDELRKRRMEAAGIFVTAGKESK